MKHPNSLYLHEWGVLLAIRLFQVNNSLNAVFEINIRIVVADLFQE